MPDAEVARLASGIMGGSLTDCGLLLDRLTELGDVRIHDLNRLLGHVIPDVTQLSSSPPGARAVRRSRTAEEDAYRRDEARYSLWRRFARSFRQLFWLELVGLPPLQALLAAENEIQGPKQATRFREEQADSEELHGAGDEEKSSSLVGY